MKCHEGLFETHRRSQLGRMRSAVDADERQRNITSIVVRPPSNLIALDLFAGCGGMSLGLENAGFKIIYANELNASAAATYKRNFPEVNLQVGDVREVNAKSLWERLGKPKVDVISAGTPCQGFSSAGRRRARDPRNRLYKEVLRFAKAFHPKLIVIENVLGMLSRRNRSLADNIMGEIRRIGYFPHLKILTASHYGVPQSKVSLPDPNARRFVGPL